jgi:hypothetical protein
MVCPAISSYSFGATALLFCLPVILRIFDENQNPVDMYTSIILQHIKAVALKL